LKKAGHEVWYRDLYEEQFDPVMPQCEVEKPPKLAPAIEEHCRLVTEADGYVVVHPNWWGQMPAMLKGWLDRVLRVGVAYEFGPKGVVPRLTGKTALVLTTSNTPREDELRLFGDPLEHYWKTCIFEFCGLTDFTRRNFESIIMSTPDERAGWLSETRRLVDQAFPPAKP
jgi:putative NADPH-quinone reductase